MENACFSLILLTIAPFSFSHDYGGLKLHSMEAGLL